MPVGVGWHLSAPSQETESRNGRSWQHGWLAFPHGVHFHALPSAVRTQAVPLATQKRVAETP